MPQGHLMPRGMVYLPETGKGAVTAAVREMLVAAGLEIVGEGPGLLAEVPDGSGRVLVPKVIHQTWKTAEIPHDIFRREWVDSWLEVNGPDGWEVRLWTDRDLEELVMGDYPDFADCYLDYDEAIKRVDAARYLILKRFGGVYADLDFACLKPLDSLLKGRRLLFGSERDNIHLNDSICNAFMASVPGHRFWDHIEDDLRMHAKSGVLSATGPRFLSRRYQNAAAFLPEGDWPLIALRESLYPFRFDSWERDEAREMSLEELKERYPRSHAVSFWTATWMPKGEEAEEEAGAFEEEIDPEVKYFKEDGGDHYDARFFRGMLGPEEKKERLLKLLSSFCGKCEEQGIKPVLMHGGLIGWSHNGRMLPWDDDVDLCVFLSDLYALDAAKKEFSDEDYLLDVNPNFVSRETQNRHHRELFEPNRIDARYVERASGVYLDLTALHAARKGEFRTKCPHVYRSEDLFPLQAAELEGVPLFVPAKVEAVLVAEYGARVLEKGEFNGYRFCEEREEWVKDGIDEEAFVRVAAATLR